MRAGPSTAALNGALRVGARVHVIRGGVVLATDVPASDVVLDYTTKNDRKVPAQLTYTCPADWYPQSPDDPLACYGQRSLVSMVYRGDDGVDFEVPLGQFVHSTWEDSRDGVEVTALDLTQLLEEDPMPWPSSPGRGATVRSELQRLASTIPVVLDDGVVDAALSRQTQWGTSRTEAIASLAAARGFGVRVGADACLHAYLVRDASYVDVLYEAGGMLLDVSPADVRGRVANRWVATGTVTKTGAGGEKTSEQKITVTRVADTPPYDHASYGWVTEHVDVSAAEDRKAVEDAADKAMSEALSASHTCSLTILPDARLEVGDIVGVVAEDGSRLAGRVAAYSLPVSDATATMRVDIDILEW